MKVAIDVLPLQTGHKFRGVGIYTQNLIGSLQLIEVTNFSVQSILQGKIPPNVDLVHYPYFDPFFLTLPLRKPKPTIVTIHDVTPLVFPDKFPKGARGWLKFQIQKLSLKGATAVITDSQNSKKDIVNHLGFPKEKIYVVPLAPGEEFKPIADRRSLITIRKKYQLPKHFILYVGDVNWNKNIEGLIRAFKKLQSSKAPKLQLVLAGKALEDKSLPETRLIFQLIKELNLIDQTRILGFVSTKNLVAIYNLAAVYCQPSFYEGFGLPVLEAMACGCPVVAANMASLQEICQKAAVMVDPYDVNDIAAGIKKVLSSSAVYDKLRKRGLKQAEKFSWKKTARQTIDVYQRVIKNF